MSQKIESTLSIVKPEDTQFVKCSNCNKPLLRLLADKTGAEVLFTVVVDCVYCSDRSWATPIYGTLRYIPADGVQLKNVVNEANNVVHFLTSKVK